MKVILLKIDFSKVVSFHLFHLTFDQGSFCSLCGESLLSQFFIGRVVGDKGKTLRATTGIVGDTSKTLGDSLSVS